VNPGNLSPLGRLCSVGSHGMGALSYEPENPSSIKALPTDLDEIDHEIQAKRVIKFRSSFDPQGISAIEYAYHLMAKDALNIILTHFGSQTYNAK
jgi:serine/threonine-protein kinase HipA